MQINFSVCGFFCTKKLDPNVRIKKEVFMPCGCTFFPANADESQKVNSEFEIFNLGFLFIKLARELHSATFSSPLVELKYI